MNTSDTVHPFNIETGQIAKFLNSSIKSASWKLSTDRVIVGLHNGVSFSMYYISGHNFGYIYVYFDGTNYNYSDLHIRQNMFTHMKEWLKERGQNANNGEDSGF